MPRNLQLAAKRVALGLMAPITFALVFTRCDGLLETEPFGSLNTGTFYKTAGDFQAATIGAYSTLQNLTYNGRDASIFEQMLLPDDDTRAPGSDEDSDFAWTPNNNSIGYIWDVSYRGVLRANVILQQLELAEELTDAQRARFEGEAKFVRAYFNFILARMFGTPPVVTQVASSIEETRLTNSQPGEIWDLIESDLESAVTGLAGLNLEAGRASEWAARALLGKVQIYRAQWLGQPEKYTAAEQHLEAVVNSGRFQLVAYEDNFDYRTENNAESLFELQASFGTDINGWAATDENGGGASAGTGRPLATGAGGLNGVNAPGGFDWGDGGIIMTPTLVDEFESYGSVTVTVPGTGEEVEVTVRDPRAYWTFYSTGEEYGRGCDAGQPVPYNFVWSCSGEDVSASEASSWSVTGHTASKYIRPFENYEGGQMLNQSVSQNNERLIRYADVLLLLAEAKILGSGDLPGAAALINQVRARARDAWDSAYGSGSIDADLHAGISRPANLLPDVVPQSESQMFEALMHERRVELALEFSRFADLVRWLRAGLIDAADIDFGDNVANERFDPDRHLLRPIPEGDLDLNPNLEQNPGY